MERCTCVYTRVIVVINELRVGGGGGDGRARGRRRNNTFFYSVARNSRGRIVNGVYTHIDKMAPAMFVNWLTNTVPETYFPPFGFVTTKRVSNSFSVRRRNVFDVSNAHRTVQWKWKILMIHKNMQMIERRRA